MRCFVSVDIRHRCPCCGELTDPGNNGLRRCPRCRWAEREPWEDGPSPFGSPRKALEALLMARGKLTGPGCNLGKGYDGSSGRRAVDFTRDHETVGTLTSAWDALEPESRIVLEAFATIPDWEENSRQCRKCGRKYGPIASRCQRCHQLYGTTDPACPKCGDQRSFPVWPMDAMSSEQVCPDPECGHHGRGFWRPVAAKSEKIAQLVSDYRSSAFHEAHGRGVMTEGEEKLVGFCPGCATWHRASVGPRGGHRFDRRCGCKGRIRWGLTVGPRAIGGLVGSALGRWSVELKGRGLV